MQGVSTIAEIRSLAVDIRPHMFMLKVTLGRSKGDIHTASQFRAPTILPISRIIIYARSYVKRVRQARNFLFAFVFVEHDLDVERTQLLPVLFSFYGLLRSRGDEDRSDKQYHKDAQCLLHFFPPDCSSV